MSLSPLHDTLHPSYSQELPKRFQKDVVKAATDKSPMLNAPTVSAEGIEHVLQNIGMGDRMSRSEIEVIVSEVGMLNTCPIDGSGERHYVISTDQMVDLISKPNSIVFGLRGPSTNFGNSITGGAS